MYLKKTLLTVFGLIPNFFIGLVPISYTLMYFPSLFSSEFTLPMLWMAYTVAYLFGTLALIRSVVGDSSRISAFGLVCGGMTTFLFVVSPLVYELLDAIGKFNSPIDNRLLALVASVIGLLPLTVFCVLFFESGRRDFGA